MRQELKEIEDKILHKLSASEGSPVDDIDLIHTLEQSKAKSMEIKVTRMIFVCLFVCFKGELLCFLCEQGMELVRNVLDSRFERFPASRATRYIVRLHLHVFMMLFVREKLYEPFWPNQKSQELSPKAVPRS